MQSYFYNLILHQPVSETELGRGFTKLSKIGMKNASPPEYHE